MTEILIFTVAASIFLLIIPSKFIVARIYFSFRLKVLCKELGYTLYSTRLLAAFGRKRCRQCEYIIEREEDIIAIKLFGFFSGKYILRFNSPRMVEINDLRFKIKVSADAIENYREHILPPYDFEYLPRKIQNKKRARIDICTKKLRKCYVICPEVLSYSIIEGSRLNDRSQRCKDIEIYFARDFLTSVLSESDAAQKKEYGCIDID